MEAKDEKLIIQIDDEQIKYVVFQADEKLEYKILLKKSSFNSGIFRGKITDLNGSIKIVGRDLKEIETELNKVFTKVLVVTNQEDTLCTNLTGFKKLNRSKVEKRDLDYILNEGKSAIKKSQKKHSIIHILNSNFILDKKKRNKIPLDIFGDHLSLHMTFISIPKNSLEKINALFEANDIKIERIIHKTFASGIDLISNKQNLKNFILVNFDKELSSISLYENSSLIFLKTFPFGTNSIYKDIIKLCSLDIEEAKSIIQELDFENFLDPNIKNLHLKKNSITQIKNIVSARIEEMTNYVFNKNKNLTHFDKESSYIYLLFEDKNISNKFGNFFQKTLKLDPKKISPIRFDIDEFSIFKGAAELIFKGWHQEALPQAHKKKSIISSFFSRFF